MFAARSPTPSPAPWLQLRGAQRLVGGRLAGGAVERFADAEVSRYVFDTRLPFDPATACFLALAGPRRSGARFVAQALERGVTRLVVSERDFDRLSPNEQNAAACYWVVPTTPGVLGSTQALAAERRRCYAGTVVGITGSNGKTIVKEWLYELLGGASAGVYRSPGSYNSQLGVALSLLALPDAASLALIEAGVSATGEMQRLAEMIRPDLGVFTKLGDAHAAGFASLLQKATEKLSLFAQAEQLIFSAEAFAASETLQDALRTLPTGVARRTWAWHASTLSRETDSGSRLQKLVSADSQLEVSVPSSGTERENLGSALAAALCLGTVEPEALVRRAGRLGGQELRLRAGSGRDASWLIDDTYNADLTGLRAAFEFFVEQRRPGQRGIAMLGPLAESGLDPKRMGQAVLELARQADCRELHLVGPAYAGIAPEAVHYKDVTALLEASETLDIAEAVVLVKGPREYQLDRVLSKLRHREHGVTMSISLSALTHNLAALRTRLEPQTRVCLMVKAGAYGSGSRELVTWLHSRGLDYLAVASTDEGVELREVGCRLPIIVANAPPSQLERLRLHDLEPEVSRLDQLEAFHELPIHLKVDTGMHRLGFDAVTTEPLDEALLAALRRLRPRAVRSVFSHLSAADDPAGDAFSRQQYARLVGARRAVEAALAYPVLAHLLNSAGTWRLAEYQLDMVRLGIGVYGLGAVDWAGAQLEPAHRLSAQLVDVRPVAAGEVVGYGLGGRADEDRIVGTVNIGYADGLRRQAGHGAYKLWVDGQPARTVGSICMDFCMIDLTRHAVTPSPGTEVEVFGRHQSAEALARCYGTIPYEVFTGIGPRVRRVYER